MKINVENLPQSTWYRRIILSGHNQKTFAKLIGKTEPQLSQWIRGEKLPRPENIRLVEKTLEGLGV